MTGQGVAVGCVRAANPGPLTLEGTNTWIVGDPDGPVVVIDPGPELSDHVAAVTAEIGQRTVVAVLLTHGHADHAASAPLLHDRYGAPVRAADPALCLGGAPLTDGDRVAIGEHSLRVLATPGHTADSVCLLLSGTLFTGDTVLGRGPSLVDHPEGRLADFLPSLGRLAELIEAGRVTQILPGHGPDVVEPARILRRAIDHREQRLAQVRAALEAGAGTVDEVVAIVYADLDPALWPAATRSVLAQFAYLDGR